MNLRFTPRGWDEYLALRDDDPKAQRKVERLIEECRRSPFRGSGKPEPLKYNMKSWWSRRITEEHRLVYRVTGTGDAQTLEIAQCRYHY